MKRWFDKRGCIKPHSSAAGHGSVTGLWFMTVLIFFIGMVHGTVSRADSQWDLKVIEKYIDSYQLESAKQKLSELTSRTRDSAKGKYLQGKLAFYGGDYKHADELLKDAIEKMRTELDWKYLRDQVKVSRRHTRNLRKSSPRNGFTFYYENGNDSILIPYALETLLSQVAKLTETLGDYPTGIRVYILPSVAMLSELCGLSTEQIEATGTVAISKYNRIMILSPSLIVGGYPWLDTLAHELTHIAITRVTQNRAPIWLHEGIAKLLEAQWRGVARSELTPVLAYLLDQAAKQRRLIPLRRFHPSVSYLPNQEDAALAYAQGLSFIRFITAQFKDGQSLETLLKTTAEKSLDIALETTTSFNITKLFQWWQHSLEGARNTPAALVPLLERRFRTMPGTRVANIDPALDREVRRHIRIGDLLQIRGHVPAAQREYEWALTKNETMTPDIVDRLVRVLLAQNNADGALRLLESMKTLYPNHSTTFLQAGEAHMKIGQFNEADDELKRAIALNPFHPDVHCMLSAIHQEQNRERLSEREKAACIKLSGAPR